MSRIYLICSIRGRKNVGDRDYILYEAQQRILADFGQALEGMERRELDLVKAGRCFSDMTGIKGLHAGQVFWARNVVDLWWSVKKREFVPGRGYGEWMWLCVREYLRVSGEGGRAWRLMVD